MGSAIIIDAVLSFPGRFAPGYLGFNSVFGGGFDALTGSFGSIRLRRRGGFFRKSWIVHTSSFRLKLGK